MSGLSYRSGTEHLIGLGLRYVSAGNGSPQDYQVRKARKSWTCRHVGPQGRPLRAECISLEIKPGDVYVLVNQGWMAEDPVSLPCAIAAGWYAPRVD